MKRCSMLLSWLRTQANRDIGRLPRWFRWFRLGPMAFTLALLSLAYLLGAAVMYFQLPTSMYLTTAFMGAQDWAVPATHASGPADSILPPPTLTAYRKGKADDGYTLCTTRGGLQVTLLDMEGNRVHHWNKDSWLAWMRAPHVSHPLPDEPVHWDNCYLYPNGDLLALCSCGTTPYGYGLVKVDRNSNLLWAHSANVHHDFDVAEDGRIYVLTQRVESNPPPGLPMSPSQFFAEDLQVLSPDGQLLTTIPLYEAFRDSDFALLFATQLWRNSSHPATRGSREFTPPMEGMLPGDVVHANSVKVLPQALAAQFPQFKPGWILLSFRSSSIIALLDPEKGHIVWAAIGPWQAQHDAQFLADGHLLLFDNLGSLDGARVLEYDPVAQSTPWAHTLEKTSQPIITYRGACQRLPNGNTLIVLPAQGVLEVTPSKETVWELSMPGLLRARRYFPHDLPFLSPGTAPRTKP
jgi:hypothetical protein